MIAAVDRAIAGLLAAPPGSGENLLLSVGTATLMGTLLALSYRVAWGKGYNRDIAASQVMRPPWKSPARPPGTAYSLDTG